jgi:alpha-beta hydrolase superfamily lysophospholipase
VNSLPSPSLFSLNCGRRLAFQEIGTRESPQVLLCLPGLLETSASFEPLLVAATHATSLRVIAIDHCGRGNSDALPMDSGYAMAIYLADTEEFISRHIFQASEPHPKLDVMGTSMGGILAMYLA